MKGIMEFVGEGGKEGSEQDRGRQPSLIKGETTVKKGDIDIISCCYNPSQHRATLCQNVD